MRYLLSFIFILFYSFCCRAQIKYESPVPGMFPIVAWYSVDRLNNNRKEYKRMANAGFNLALTTPLPKEEILTGLIASRGTGVKLIVDCAETRKANTEFINAIKENESVGMYYLYDEPSSSDFSILSALVDSINVADGKHMPYINLLPAYATKDLLRADSYEGYIEDYLRTIHIPFLSYDYYPFVRDIFRNGYYENLQIVADACKKKGIPFWGFALTAKNKDYYLTTEGKLRFQVFSNIAYGAQGIQYFTYIVPKGYGIAILDSNYNKTYVYSIVRRINKEVQIIAKYCIDASFTTVIHVDKNTDIPQHSIRGIEVSGKGVLLSFFEKEGQSYVIIVNKDFDGPQDISISFDHRVFQANRRGKLSAGKEYYCKKMTAGDWLMFRL